MKKRILFVDDDAFLLAGLRRLLRSCRNEWDMEFVGGGEEAIQRMNERAFDVVVSDMRMPGMDGAQLLSAIRTDFPDAVRIILSGQSAQEVVFRSVGPAHQFLSKPCSGDKLKLAILRACNVSSWIGDDAVLELMRRIESIPELPESITQLIHMLQDNETKPEEVASLIESDSKLAKILLVLVNLMNQTEGDAVVNVQAAAELLGVDQLRPLILAAFAFSKFGPDEEAARDEMQRALRVALAARTLARLESNDNELADQAMMAGMQYGIGRLLIAKYLPEEYQAIEASAEVLGDLFAAEQKVLSTTSARVGGFILCNWGLPTPVVEAVAFQSSPREATLKEFSPMIALYLARHLVGMADNTVEDDALDHAMLRDFGVAVRMVAWKSAVQQMPAIVG